MKPGAVMDSMSTHTNYEIVPFTEELHEQLTRSLKISPENKMQQVYFLMVETALFADGSVYKDEVTANSLGTFLREHGCDN